MKTIKLISLCISLCVLAICSDAGERTLRATQRASPEVQSTQPETSPDAVVANLYKQHQSKHSPFFQTKNRALLDRYFEKHLADLIWKDATQANGEVGAIDGDPLFNAQDMDIKKFSIGKPQIKANEAQVNVSFENFGKKVKVIFLLVSQKANWKISDIKYDDGTTLAGILKASANDKTGSSEKAN